MLTLSVEIEIPERALHVLRELPVQDVLGTATEESSGGDCIAVMI